MSYSFDVSGFSSEAASTPRTLNFTQGAGATLLVLGIVDASLTNQNPRKRTGGNPTYGGLSMTFVIDCSNPTGAAGSAETWVEMWYLLNTSTGSSYSLSVPNTSGQQMQLHVASFKVGTDRTASAIDVSTILFSGALANPLANIHTTRKGDVIVGLLGDGLNSAPTAQTGSLLSSQYVATHSGAMQYKIQTAVSGDLSVGWTIASDDVAAILGSWKETYTVGKVSKVAGVAIASISKVSTCASTSIEAIVELGSMGGG